MIIRSLRCWIGWFHRWIGSRGVYYHIEPYLVEVWHCCGVHVQLECNRAFRIGVEQASAGGFRVRIILIKRVKLCHDSVTNSLEYAYIYLYIYIQYPPRVPNILKVPSQKYGTESLATDLSVTNMKAVSSESHSTMASVFSSPFWLTPPKFCFSF